MSSFRTKDKVTLILRHNEEGATGRFEPVEDTRITAFGRMNESSTTDIQDVTAAGEVGVSVLTMKRLTLTGRYIGIADDLTQVIDAAGVKYSVVGEPKRHRGFRATQRDVLLLRATAAGRGVRG